MAYFGAFPARYFAPVYFAGNASSFPTQFGGLRFFHGSVQELCLVAVNDEPNGGPLRVAKNDTVYAVYLVEVSDPNASALRVATVAGTMSARLLT